MQGSCCMTCYRFSCLHLSSQWVGASIRPVSRRADWWAQWWRVWRGGWSQYRVCLRWSKTLCFSTKKGKTQVKCKGVTLSAVNSKVVTPESLKGLVRVFVANRGCTFSCCVWHHQVRWSITREGAAWLYNAPSWMLSRIKPLMERFSTHLVWLLVGWVIVERLSLSKASLKMRPALFQPKLIILFTSTPAGSL